MFSKDLDRLFDIQLLLREYAFLKNRQFSILSLKSNQKIILQHFYKMDALVQKENLSDIEIRIELSMTLDKLNTFIAMAALNEVMEHEVQFQYLSRFPMLLFRIHLNKMKILKSIDIDPNECDISELPKQIKLLKQLQRVKLKGQTIDAFQRKSM